MIAAEVLSALATAVEAEKESLEAYLKFAWQTRDQSGRQMLIRLALDELYHMRLLEKQQTALRRTGEWLTVAVGESDVERLVPRLSDRSIRIRGTSGQNEQSALQAALEAENAATEFYQSQSRAASTPEARDMFARLAEMEAGHAALVQAEIDNITETGFWFGVPEFTMESER
jgi:rubrerythrin